MADAHVMMFSGVARAASTHHKYDCTALLVIGTACMVMIYQIYRIAMRYPGTPNMVRLVLQEAFKAREAEMMARSEAAWKQYQEQRGE